MSKPVHGDEQYDEIAEQLTDAVIRHTTEQCCRNLSLVRLKSLGKAMKLGTAQIDDAIATKLQQSIGGLKGSIRAKEAQEPGLTDLQKQLLL
jgi:hypothetical protein